MSKTHSGQRNTELRKKNDLERIEIFSGRQTFFGCKGRTLRRVWDSRDVERASLGRPPKISDVKLNEILVQAVVRQAYGMSFSPVRLAQKLVEEATKHTVHNQTIPRPRTISNYVSLLKQMGLKFVPRPRLRDVRRLIARDSLRNGLSTYAVTTATHEEVPGPLIFNIDPCSIIYGYADNSFCAAVAPLISSYPVCTVGKKPVSLPQVIKLLPIANYDGLMGPIVLVRRVKRASILDGSEIVKVPLYGWVSSTRVTEPISNQHMVCRKWCSFKYCY